MRLSVATLVGWLAVCWSAPALAQEKQIVSPAQMVQAPVLGYAELIKPGATWKEVRQLFKGTALYDMPDSFAELEAKYSHGVFGRLSLMPPKMFGVMLAPEVVQEFGKIQGAAVALFGMKMDRGPVLPDYVVIIQPGQSNAPSFLMRTLLATTPMKVLDTVAGVKIYQQSTLFGGGPDGFRRALQPPNVEARADIPAFAMMPGNLLIGSPKAVKDAILRGKGLVKGNALAESKDFQQAHKKIGGEAGLFAYGDMSAMMDMIRDMGNAGPPDPDLAQFMEAYIKFINPKAIRSWSIATGLEKGTLHFAELIQLNPKEKSGILDLYATKAVNTDVLHFAPKDSVFAFAMSNADGNERWDRLVKNLNAMIPAKAFGGQKLGEHIANFEQTLGVKLGPDVVGKTTNIGVAIGNPVTAPIKVTKIQGPNFSQATGEPMVPMVLILETTDAKAAQTVKDVIQKACRLANNGADPVIKKIKGQSVYTMNVLPSGTVAYGLAGNTVVVGPYADAVGQALADGVAKKGLASDAKAMAQAKAFKDPIAVSAMKPGLLIVGSLFMGTSHSSTFKSVDKEVGPGGKLIPPQQRQQPVTTVTIEKDTPEQAKLKKEIMKLMDHEPWMIMGTMRSEDYILVQGTSPGWDKFMPRLIDFVIEKTLEQSSGGKKAVAPQGDIPQAPRLQGAELKRFSFDRYQR